MRYIRVLSKLFDAAIKKVKKLKELSRYSDFTIAEYFRMQGAQIGEGCRILPRFLGDEPYLVKIGNNVTIAGGVIFVTHDGGAWIFRKEVPDIQVFGTIIIEDNCVIGQNAILFPNIRIGKNSIIGAGSVVISDILENSIAMGVPARAFSSVDKYKEKCFERWSKQRPPNCIIEDGRTWWNSKYYEENRKKLKEHLINLFWKRMQSEQKGQAEI